MLDILVANAFNLDVPKILSLCEELIYMYRVSPNKRSLGYAKHR